MTDQSSTDEIRLNKYIASSLAIGRRQVDYLIGKGQVRVNGKVPELGARIHDGDQVTVSGKPLESQAKPMLYVALNKPEGYVCSRKQQGLTPTIYALLPEAYQHLKPVGRLDKDTSGLLLLTNDGDFAHKLTHPKFIKHKQYEVTLRQPLEPLHHQMINDIGVTLPDGVSKLSLQRIEEGDSNRWIVTMHEGRNRQIRRTFGSLGYQVLHLHRTMFGAYHLGDLATGHVQAVAKAY